jgi:hypothetical protein
MDCTPTAVPYAIPEPAIRHCGLLVRTWNWVVASRSHRVWCLVAGLWLVNLFDLALTLMAHHAGMLQEVNPVAAFLLSQGPIAVALYKVGLVAFGSGTLIYHRRRLLAELTACTVFLVYGLVAVQWKWCYELYDLSHSGAMTGADLKAVGGWVAGVPTL